MTIDVWLNDFPWPGLKDAVKKLTEDFNEAHPGHEINLRFVNYWTMPARVAKAVEEGNPPAIAEYYYTNAQQARDAKAKDGTPLYTPVGDAIAGRTEILGVPVVSDDIVAAARDYYSYDGTLFAIPREQASDSDERHL